MIHVQKYLFYNKSRYMIIKNIYMNCFRRYSRFNICFWYNIIIWFLYMIIYRYINKNFRIVIILVRFGAGFSLEKKGIIPTFFNVLFLPRRIHYIISSYHFISLSYCWGLARLGFLGYFEAFFLAVYLIYAVKAFCLRFSSWDLFTWHQLLSTGKTCSSIRGPAHVVVVLLLVLVLKSLFSFLSSSDLWIHSPLFCT